MQASVDSTTSITIEKALMPNHIGFIIDGNRRWAKENEKSVFDGHSTGLENVKKTVKNCINLGIKNTTFFAFSIENWNRHKTEVSNLLKIFKNSFNDKEFTENKDINIKFIGNLGMLPKELFNKVKEINNRELKEDAKINVNIAISYSGQDEILRAHQISKDTGLEFTQCLDFANKTPIDLLVRTGGEMRISNFMLWDISYSELFFTNKKWPEFDYYVLSEAVISYVNRSRRYGL